MFISFFFFFFFFLIIYLQRFVRMFKFTLFKCKKSMFKSGKWPLNCLNRPGRAKPRRINHLAPIDNPYTTMLGWGMPFDLSNSFQRVYYDLINNKKPKQCLSNARVMPNTKGMSSAFVAKALIPRIKML